MQKLVRVTTVVLIWGIFAAFSVKAWNVYQADIAYETSQDYVDNGDYLEALKLADRAIELNPYEPNYYRGRARINTISLSVATQEYIPDLKKLILEDLKHSYALNPNNLVTIRNLIPLYYFLATKDIAVKEDSGNVDLAYLSPTLEFFKMAKARFVTDAGVYVLVARYEKRLGQENELTKTLEHIRKLRPDLLDWYQL